MYFGNVERDSGLDKRFLLLRKKNVFRIVCDALLENNEVIASAVRTYEALFMLEQ